MPHSGRRTRHRQLPRDATDRLHRPEPDGARRPSLRPCQDLEDEVGNARIWGGIHFRSAVEDGIEIGKKTVHQVLAHHFQKSKD